MVKCHKDVLGFLAMSCSIRVSDKLYQDAQFSSELQDRSIAQQIEHWARVGQASEISSNYEFDLINIKLKQQFAKDFKAIREGRLCQTQLMFFDPQKIENVKVTFPDLSETDLYTMFHNYFSD